MTEKLDPEAKRTSPASRPKREVIDPDLLGDGCGCTVWAGGQSGLPASWGAAGISGRRRGSGACQDIPRSNKPCATTISTRSVSPDCMSLHKLNPVEPPWYVTRMPGEVAPRGVPLSRSSAQPRHSGPAQRWTAPPANPDVARVGRVLERHRNTRSSAITMLTAHEEHVRNFGVDTAISTMSGQ
jgi:hypothetical protein